MWREVLEVMGGREEVVEMEVGVRGMWRGQEWRKHQGKDTFEEDVRVGEEGRGDVKSRG